MSVQFEPTDAGVDGPPDAQGPGCVAPDWAIAVPPLVPEMFPAATPFGLGSDGTGGIYISGLFGRTVDLGDGETRTSRGETDAFLMRLDDSTRKVVWARDFGFKSVDSSTAVAVNQNGTVAVIGDMSSYLNLGDGLELGPGAQFRQYLAGFSSSDGKPLFLTHVPLAFAGVLEKIRSDTRRRLRRVWLT